MVVAGFLLGYLTAVADALDPNGEKRIVEHKCPAVGPVVPLPVWGTEGLQVPGLVDVEPRLARSSLLLPVTWDTWAVQGRATWPE